MVPSLRLLTNACCLLAAICSAGASAHADAVLDWNQIAIDTVTASGQSAPMTTRSMTIVHAAMFDAVNSIERRFTRYRIELSAGPGASSDAAAAAAAHATLRSLFPDQAGLLDAAFAAVSNESREDDSIAAGIRLGEEVARQYLAWRADDGTGARNGMRRHAEPARYVPAETPLGQEFARSRPWLMDRPDRFRPGPPPELGSADWVRDHDEVVVLGAQASRQRTEQQTAIALFWTIDGAAVLNPVVQQFATARDPVDEARIFALAWLAAADSQVAAFDAKYAFKSLRPTAVVRGGDGYRTAADTTWLSLVGAPRSPEYPCEDCLAAAAIGAVLEAEFGEGRVRPFMVVSPTIPGAARSWERIGAYVDEVCDARIWSGVQFRNSVDVAKRMGRKIGDLAVDNYMTARD
jgi:hypothetical protein